MIMSPNEMCTIEYLGKRLVDRIDKMQEDFAEQILKNPTKEIQDNLNSCVYDYFAGELALLEETTELDANLIIEKIKRKNDKIHNHKYDHEYLRNWIDDLLAENEKITRNIVSRDTRMEEIIGCLEEENDRLKNVITSMVLDRHGPPPPYENLKNFMTEFGHEIK